MRQQQIRRSPRRAEPAVAEPEVADPGRPRGGLDDGTSLLLEAIEDVLAAPV